MMNTRQHACRHVPDPVSNGIHNWHAFQARRYVPGSTYAHFSAAVTQDCMTLWATRHLSRRMRTAADGYERTSIMNGHPPTLDNALRHRYTY
jgi:hypothetical protein